MLMKFEQNRMVQTTQNFQLFDKKQCFFFITTFEKRVDAILEDVSVSEIIETINFEDLSFSVPKITALLTFVTWLKLHQTWPNRSVSTRSYRSFKHDIVPNLNWISSNSNPVSYWVTWQTNRELYTRTGQTVFTIYVWNYKICTKMFYYVCRTLL